MTRFRSDYYKYVYSKWNVSLKMYFNPKIHSLFAAS